MPNHDIKVYEAMFSEVEMVYAPEDNREGFKPCEEKHIEQTKVRICE